MCHVQVSVVTFRNNFEVKVGENIVKSVKTTRNIYAQFLILTLFIIIAYCLSINLITGITPCTDVVSGIFVISGKLYVMSGFKVKSSPVFLCHPQ